ncbi:hypothetical protein AMATHDRAFT_47541 [Amanita thiersii Skay4041]|uniref:UPF3 domain-containing protein n=1 Tax=Amanita thiersii Skay4041 TaxID=703135 RepID=A0A2A9NT22_9AGAR|nr:hypothetical protein AMATHDRAFT_47541 [Amanita thiersii Skay4041]
MPQTRQDLPFNAPRREKLDRTRAAPSTPAAAERLKTVVRRLPPNLPEDVFWQSVQQWVTDDTTVWKAFHSGKFKKKVNKETVPSRAYIVFKNEEILAQFSREYDGHVFRDKQGNESQAVVEFSPFQKVPSDKKKGDKKNATIEEDEDYQSFITSLNEQASAEPVSIETLVASIQPLPQPKTTPLLEALKAEKTANKDKEAILRNHAHYKDPAVANAMRNVNVVSTMKDDAGKKKSGPAAGPSQVKDHPGKKGKKAQALQAAALKQQQQQAQKRTMPTTPSKKDTPRQSKSPKAARQQEAPSKSVTTAQAAEAPAVSASSSGEGKTPAVVNPPSMEAVSAQVSAAAAARRTRPIVGLASRQLQAALSQVGAAAVERKRRERERDTALKDGASSASGTALGTTEVNNNAVEKQKEKEHDPEAAGPGPRVDPTPTNNTPSSTGTAGKEEREKLRPGPPTSPRHDRRRKEKERKGVHPEGAGVKVPSIMQRPEGVPPLVLQRDTAGQSLPGPAQVPATTSGGTSGDATSGGIPRGSRRGRGRGRGGMMHRGG